MRPSVILLALSLLVLGCREEPMGASGGPWVMRPQTVALIATPKILPDFDKPDSAVAAFLDNYSALTTRASETVVIFAVGNTDHILMYRGAAYWQDQVEWARQTNGIPVDHRVMTFTQLAGIVAAFRKRGTSLGITLKIFDQVDSGVEFTDNPFKWGRHSECMDWDYESWNIRATMVADDHQYATAPTGIAEGTQCGTFLVDQTAAYMADLGFDGILCGNSLGTRGHWKSEWGPGYSEAEAAAIRDFFEYSRAKYGARGLIWFDTYHTTVVERDTWSVSPQTYVSMDYILAAGFCVITWPERYEFDLASKLEHQGPSRILATLDYVDPWYTYDSMTDYAEESARLERIAIQYRYRVDGIAMFANDRHGRVVPKHYIDSFATRYFTDVPASR